MNVYGDIERELFNENKNVVTVEFQKIEEKKFADEK